MQTPLRPVQAVLVCQRCQHARRSLARPRGLHSSARTADDDFLGMEAELLRRKRKAEAKRRQGGADFVDHLVVTVRGGKGGSGASAFTQHPARRNMGIPSGGNGGQGGSVYLRTSPHLTSLARISKRQIGGQGEHGAGNMRHGKRGGDVVVDVPVGTVVKQLRSESAAEQWAREDVAQGLSEDMRREKRWGRWFVSHPSAAPTIDECKAAENVLRDEGFFRRSTADPVMLDISAPLSEPILLSQGGRGGLGNPHFINPASPSTPARLASKGSQPDTLTLSFELKLLADVGLVGLPNAGKSTILRSLTGRGAEVASYAFTTLNPQIGVVRVLSDGSWRGEEGVLEESEVVRQRAKDARDRGDYQSPPASRSAAAAALRAGDLTEITRFTISDNPGLLARASENVGLGHSFLRSIERSLALVYVLDLGSDVPDKDLLTLKDELELYKPGLAGKAVAVVLNKGDEVDEEVGRERVERVRAVVQTWQTQAAERKAVEKRCADSAEPDISARDAEPELDVLDGMQSGEQEQVPPGTKLGISQHDDDLEVIVLSAKFGLGMKRLVDVLCRRIEAVRAESKRLDKVTNTSASAAGAYE